MKKSLFLIPILAWSMQSNAQSNLAYWNFNSTVNDATPSTGELTPTIGSGTITAIGGISQTFVTGSPLDPNSTDNSGCQTNGYPSSGTSPQTAGLELAVSTTGFSKVAIDFWQRLSNTAANTWVLQYTLDNTGLSTGGTVLWLNATTFSVTPASTGTGDTWYFRTYDFATVTGLGNNATAGFRIVSDFDPTAGNYVAATFGSSYSTAGTSRFDLVRLRESYGSASIIAANNYQAISENAGTINVPVTYANANNAPAKLVVSVSSYSSATSGSDFNWTNDTLTIPALTNGITNFPINIIDDTEQERTETLIVKIGAAANTTVSATDYYQLIYIKDNDYSAPTATNEAKLSLLTSFSNGASGTNSAEIVAHDPTNQRLYIANSIGAELDIVDFSNPNAPVLVNSISVTPYGNINSVTVHDGLIALAIESVPAQANGSVVFLDGNGNFLNQVTVGAMPDMITFNKDYTKVLTANEGEPSAAYSTLASNNIDPLIDPLGSVSIIDLSAGIPALTNSNVTTLDFTAYNGQEALLKNQGIRIFSSAASVAQDMEPEYITISEDNSKAYVSIQENNALLVIDLATQSIDTLYPLGYADYSNNNGMDASDQTTGQILISSVPVKGAYMPDAIASSSINGTNYVFSANEGDSREFGAVIDAARINSLTLDATQFPNQEIIKNNKYLGRLSALKYSGDTDNDGDLDELHTMGGRSFSVWNAETGELVYDSKDLIERIISQNPSFAAIFNASNSTGTPALKNRSDDKGPEPEGVATAFFNNTNYLFVSLERIGGSMIFNVNDPANPIYVGYSNNRSTTSSGPDLGAEGIIFITEDNSPTGEAMLILANEISSTLSIFEFKTCSELAKTEISAIDSVLCEGENTTISFEGTSGSSWQWLLNGTPISGETTNSINASNAGAYAVYVQSDLFACRDTSALLELEVNALPNVSAIASDNELCYGEELILTASGAENYSWNAGVQSNTAFVPESSQMYSVTGTDVNGCENIDQVYVNVYQNPVVIANVSDSVICEGQNVVFYGSGAQTYNWSNGIQNGLASAPINSSTYVVIGIDINGCQDTSSVDVTVNEVPVVFLGNDTTICTYNSPLILTATPGYDSYSWNFGGAANTFSVTQTGSYLVQVTSADGCVTTDEIVVTVDPCLGVDELASTFAIYPNPATEKISIEVYNSDEFSAYLMDGTGRIIESAFMKGNKLDFNLNHLANGVYSIIIQTGETRITKKFVKQ
ncbi:MAG: choice-of-anchor I family protein [Flavobacteriia bacterium]